MSFIMCGDAMLCLGSVVLSCVASVRRVEDAKCCRMSFLTCRAACIIAVSSASGASASSSAFSMCVSSSVCVSGVCGGATSISANGIVRVRG